MRLKKISIALSSYFNKESGIDLNSIDIISIALSSYFNYTKQNLSDLKWKNFNRSKLLF